MCSNQVNALCVEVILKACGVADTSIVETIKSKIKNRESMYGCIPCDIHWERNTSEEHLAIQTEVGASSEQGDNSSCAINALHKIRFRGWWKRHVSLFVLLFAFFCIVSGSAFVLSFPRSQAHVWRNGWRFHELIIAVLGASVAVAALIICLVLATDSFKSFWFQKLSKYIQISLSLQRLHCYFGVMVVVGSVVHSIVWLLLYWNLSHTPRWEDYDTEYESIGNIGARTRTFHGLCTSYVSITGYCMLVLLACGLLLPSRAVRKLLEKHSAVKGFLIFQYSHWVMAIGFISLLMIHPLPTLPSFNPDEGFGSIAWIFLLMPLLLMIVSLAMRLKRKWTSRSRIVNLTCLSGSTVHMIVAAPQGRAWTPGAFVQCRIPSISRYEWHPFSIVSIQNGSEIGLYIKCSGSWTRKLYDQVSRGQLLPSQSCYIDGPYATGTFSYKHYRNVVLVAGGIGVTPFISIIRDLAQGKQDAFHSVTLVWVVRDISAARYWFTEVFQSIEHMCDGHHIKIEIWFTGLKDQPLDLCRLVSCMHSDVYNRDLISGLEIVSSRVTSHFGRPNFSSVLGEICCDEQKDDFSIGVFSCGPSGLIASLQETCTYFSYVLGHNLSFHTEEFRILQ